MSITPERSGPLPQGVLLELASVLGRTDGVIMVGGQALALWAERYNALRPELAALGPLSSADLDYFGPRSAADKLAKVIGGVAHLPDADDHTPNTAVVTGAIGGTRVQIDFLWSVAGVQEADLKRQALELALLGDGAASITIPIMHPLHCLQSRIANVVTLRRRDALVLRQLAAAPLVFEAWIDEMLGLGRTREATATLQALFRYLRSDILGRRCGDLPMRHPAEIFARFEQDDRIDRRYRRFNLGTMLSDLRQADDR